MGEILFSQNFKEKSKKIFDYNKNLKSKIGKRKELIPHVQNLENFMIPSDISIIRWGLWWSSDPDFITLDIPLNRIDIPSGFVYIYFD